MRGWVKETILFHEPITPPQSMFVPLVPEAISESRRSPNYFISLLGSDQDGTSNANPTPFVINGEIISIRFPQVEPLSRVKDGMGCLRKEPWLSSVQLLPQFHYQSRNRHCFSFNLWPQKTLYDLTVWDPTFFLAEPCHPPRHPLPIFNLRIRCYRRSMPQQPATRCAPKRERDTCREIRHVFTASKSPPEQLSERPPDTPEQDAEKEEPSRQLQTITKTQPLSPLESLWPNSNWCFTG